MDYSRRHIQDHGEANTTLQHYWAYPSRVLPCTKDAGTCEYLDAVYRMHTTSMLYTFILWAVILGTLVIWAVLRLERIKGPGGLVHGIAGRFERIRLSLLPDARPLIWLFGRVSRLQLTVLAVILAYLLVFSLVGIVYKTWVTPINGSSLHNTRTGLGGWSDRLGAQAYALTPFAVLLCQRESVLSVMTGIPYQHFNFLHRWLGRVIFVQSFLHTLGWTIVEGKLYQPQPSTYKEFMAQQYIVFGVLAMAFITYLTIFSTERAIRWTGYEFFKVTHWIIAILYCGACWGHWDKLWCWMVPSLALMVIDQLIRLARTAYIHRYGGTMTFNCAQAQVSVFTDSEGTVVRLDLDHERAPWQAGQHFYLTFPSLSIWQSHPFTVSSLSHGGRGLHHHVYLIRVRDGQTKKLAAFENSTLPVILTGPYGNAFPSFESQHVLAVAGGTGVTFTLPIMTAASQQFTTKNTVLDFVWVVRKTEDMLWLGCEMMQLKNLLDDIPGLTITIFVSRESGPRPASPIEKAPMNANTDSPDGAGKCQAPTDSLPLLQLPTIHELVEAQDSRFKIHFLEDHHPSVADIVSDFTERTTMNGDIRTVEILGSGPEAMGSDLRSAVAEINGVEDVRFYWDSRE